MRLKCIGCEALARPVYLAAAQSPHLVDVTMLQIGLHNRPNGLRERLQQMVDEAAEQGYDAVVMAYALCGKATEGLAARGVPLVIPKGHDCITLFLGSREKYAAEQAQCPGTYWYEQDYIERGALSEQPVVLGGASTGTEEDIQKMYATYVKKYGQDNADYLMEVMGAWRSHYERAVYLDLGLGDGAKVEEQARSEAQRRGWRFERMAGDMVLIRRLLEGDWERDFVVLQPGQKIQMTFDDEVIGPADA